MLDQSRESCEFNSASKPPPVPAPHMQGITGSCSAYSSSSIKNTFTSNFQSQLNRSNSSSSYTNNQNEMQHRQQGVSLSDKKQIKGQTYQQSQQYPNSTNHHHQYPQTQQRQHHLAMISHQSNDNNSNNYVHLDSSNDDIHRDGFTGRNSNTSRSSCSSKFDARMLQRIALSAEASESSVSHSMPRLAQLTYGNPNQQQVYMNSHDDHFYNSSHSSQKQQQQQSQGNVYQQQPPQQQQQHLFIQKNNLLSENNYILHLHDIHQQQQQQQQPHLQQNQQGFHQSADISGIEVFEGIESEIPSAAKEVPRRCSESNECSHVRVIVRLQEKNNELLQQNIAIKCENNSLKEQLKLFEQQLQSFQEKQHRYDQELQFKQQQQQQPELEQNIMLVQNYTHDQVNNSSSSSSNTNLNNVPKESMITSHNRQQSYSKLLSKQDDSCSRICVTEQPYYFGESSQKQNQFASTNQRLLSSHSSTNSIIAHPKDRCVTLYESTPCSQQQQQQQQQQQSSFQVESNLQSQKYQQQRQQRTYSSADDQQYARLLSEYKSIVGQQPSSTALRSSRQNRCTTEVSAADSTHSNNNEKNLTHSRSGLSLEAVEAKFKKFLNTSASSSTVRVNTNHSSMNRILNRLSNQVSGSHRDTRQIVPTSNSSRLKEQQGHQLQYQHPHQLYSQPVEDCFVKKKNITSKGERIHQELVGKNSARDNTHKTKENKDNQINKQKENEGLTKGTASTKAKARQPSKIGSVKSFSKNPQSSKAQLVNASQPVNQQKRV